MELSDGIEFSVRKANVCNYARLAAQPFNGKYMRSGM